MAQYKCRICLTVYEVGPKDEIPACSKQAKCANGKWMYKVEKVESTSYDHAAKAAEYGYVKDTTGSVRNGYTGGGVHKPGGTCYINGKYAISPDGSTHSSGKACWKGFKSTAQGWKYLGSFNESLDQVDRGGGEGPETLPKK
ncbi:MAG TPA: hypothetical protein DEH78_31440 [Solibacterales bacterium]|nr:hypothetical protein [Bryobacterales bacterium]